MYTQDHKQICLTLQRLRQEDHKYEASLAYGVQYGIKNKQTIKASDREKHAGMCEMLEPLDGTAVR